MTAWVWAPLAVAGSLLILAGSDLVSEEVRGWLDLAPRAILRLATVQLKPGQRKKVYEDVWIPDLLYVLRGKESRPITRLIRGMWFAFDLLISVVRGRYQYPTTPNTKATPATNEDVRQAKQSWQSSRRATPQSGAWQRRARPSRSVDVQPGESLAFAVRKHPVILARSIFAFLIALVIAVWLSVSLNGSSVVIGVIWLLWGLFLLNLIRKIAEWWVAYLVVTSKRIVLAKGIVSRKTDTIPVGNVTSWRLQRSLQGQILGYGELIVQSGNEQTARNMPYIPYPEQINQELSAVMIPP